MPKKKGPERQEITNNLEDIEVCDSSNTYSAKKAERNLGLSEAESLTENPHPNKKILAIADELDKEKPNEKEVPPVQTLLKNVLTTYLTDPFRERIQATIKLPHLTSDEKNEDIKTDLHLIAAIEAATEESSAHIKSIKTLAQLASIKSSFEEYFERTALRPLWYLIKFVSPFKAILAGVDTGKKLANYKTTEWFGANELKITLANLKKSQPTIDTILERTLDEAALERPKDPSKTKNLMALLKTLSSSREITKNKTLMASLEFAIRLLTRVKDDTELAKIKEAIYPLTFYIAHIPHLTQIAQKTLDRENGEKTTLNTRELLDTFLPEPIPKGKKTPETFLVRRKELENRLKKTIADPYYSTIQLVLNRMERLIVQEGEEKATKLTMKVLETITGPRGKDYDVANVLVKYLANTSNESETVLAKSLINLNGKYIAYSTKKSFAQTFRNLNPKNLPFFRLFAQNDTKKEDV